MKPRCTCYFWIKNRPDSRWTVILDNMRECFGYGTGRNIRQAYNEAVKCAKESYRDRWTKNRHRAELKRHGLAP